MGPNLIAFAAVRPPSQPKPVSVNQQIHCADCNTQADEQGFGEIRINQPVQIINQKAAVARIHPGLPFERPLRQSQWARQGSQLHYNSPNKRQEVKGREQRAAARPERSEDDPKDPDEMNCQDDRGQNCERAANPRVRRLS